VVKKLIERCRCVAGGNSYFDWRLLGVEAGACFNAVPANVTFLNGHLMDGRDKSQEGKVRAVRQRRVKNDAEDAVMEKPEDVKGHTDRNEDNLSAVQKNIQAVGDALNAKVDRRYRACKAQLAEAYGGHDNIPERVLKKLKKNPDQCAIELLFNPLSFTQTVENIFHYSFLVKKGSAALTVREEDRDLDSTAGLVLRGGPVAKYIKAREVMPEPRQALVSLTLEEFRDLVEAYGVTKSDVPHRTGSKHGKLTSSSSAGRGGTQTTTRGSDSSDEEEGGQKMGEEDDGVKDEIEE
jgi:non-structural maintenance of chromosomes element 4